MSHKDRLQLLRAIDTAATAEREYRAGSIDLSAYTRAMNHAVVVRDRLQLSFFQIVKVD